MRSVALVSTTFHDVPSEYQGSPLPEEPLDVMYAAAAMERVDARIVASDDHEAIAGVDAVILSTTNSYLQWNNHPMGLGLLEMAWNDVRAAKRENVPTVAIGPHVPANHEELYRLGLDHVLLGESELVAAELAQSLALGEPVGDHLLGARWPPGSDTAPTPAVVSDMDLLPRPAYEQTVDTVYNAHNHPAPRGPGHLYECSRGCPFFCSFCNTVTHRRAHRVKSVDKIDRDLTELAELTPNDYVYFIDESFGFRKDWFFDLMKRLSSLPFTYGCQGNLGFLSEDKVDAYAEAGFVNLEFGYETADVEIMKRVGKNNKMPKVRALLDRACEAGISPLLFVQMGLPGDTLESLLRNLEFLGELDEAVRVSIALPTPYFGTKLWQEGVDDNVYDPTTSGADLYAFSGRIGHSMTFTEEQAQDFANRYGPNHNLSPAFLTALEHDVRSVFGP